MKYNVMRQNYNISVLNLMVTHEYSVKVMISGRINLRAMKFCVYRQLVSADMGTHSRNYKKLKSGKILIKLKKIFKNLQICQILEILALRILTEFSFNNLGYFFKKVRVNSTNFTNIQKLKYNYQQLENLNLKSWRILKEKPY